MSMLLSLVSIVQFLVLAYYSSKAIRTLQFHFFYSSDLSQYRPISGGKAWALISGASDGIGEATAHELCARGFNVIIHGRNEKKLLGVKAALENGFPGSEVRLLVLDAMSSSSWTDEAESKVLSVVEGTNLTVLVNNVGGMGGIKPDYAPVARRSAQQLDQCINLNARFMTQITRVLLPILSRDKDQRATIVNISSATELVPAAYLVTYSATKAYVGRWSIGLEAELKAEKMNIDVHSMIVGLVVTANMAQNGAKVGFFGPNATTMAKAVLAKLGCGHVICTPFWPHALQVGIIGGLMPSWFAAKFMGDIAREAMAKDEIEEKVK